MFSINAYIDMEQEDDAVKTIIKKITIREKKLNKKKKKNQSRRGGKWRVWENNAEFDDRRMKKEKVF